MPLFNDRNLASQNQCLIDAVRHKQNARTALLLDAQKLFCICSLVK